MRMNKRITVALSVLVLVSIASLLATRQQRSSSTVPSAKLNVVASFYPLAEFAKQVGGDKVVVKNITPAGAEPHDFDPSPQDIVALQNSQVLIYNGAGLEPWVDRVLPDIAQRGVVVVKASNDSMLLPGNPGYDPHFWLDPALASQEVAIIAEGLIKADPGTTATYQANAAAYQAQLRQLDQEFSRGLSQCQRQDIVTSHAAFAYLARHYHLHMIPIAGVSPDEEPAPQRLAQIAQVASEHDVKYIFFETLVSPRLSQTIAKEVGAQTLAFNPLEGLTDQEQQQGKNYVSVQRENLVNLRLALGCL